MVCHYLGSAKTKNDKVTAVIAK